VRADFAQHDFDFDFAPVEVAVELGLALRISSSAWLMSPARRRRPRAWRARVRGRALLREPGALTHDEPHRREAAQRTHEPTVSKTHA